MVALACNFGVVVIPPVSSLPARRPSATESLASVEKGVRIVAMPKNTVVLKSPMDSNDIVDFELNFADILDDQNVELIQSRTLTMSAEGAALGLTIGTGQYIPTMADGNRAIRIWLSVTPALQLDPNFDGGVLLPIVAKIVTTSSPPRQYERTFAVLVQQQ